MSSLSNEDLEIVRSIEENIQSCILGKQQEIRLTLTALLAGGHILVEDVPGTGKTLLIKALAKSIKGQFRRIQCNPDLLPTDITGVSIYHPKDENFVFRPGPVMTNILLIDEINRATTKTQSALLEAMEERHITVDGECYDLPKPFLLLATQNPIEFEGTYLLPEAQLDRFMFKFSLGYPDQEKEREMVNSQSKHSPLDALEPVAEMEKILELQEKAKAIHIDIEVANYIVDIVRQTRQHRSIFLGASPRATMIFVHAVKAYALINERDYVIPDDVKFLVPYILKHRIILQADARMDGETADTVLQSVLKQVRVPVRLGK